MGVVSERERASRWRQLLHLHLEGVERVVRMCEVYLHQIICRLSYPRPSGKEGGRVRGSRGGGEVAVGVEPFVLRRQRPYLKEESGGMAAATPTFLFLARSLVLQKKPRE